MRDLNRDLSPRAVDVHHRAEYQEEEEEEEAPVACESRRIDSRDLASAGRLECRTVSKQYPGRADRGGFPRTRSRGIYLASMYIYYDVNGVNGAGGYKATPSNTLCGQKDDDLRSLRSAPAFVKL